MRPLSTLSLDDHDQEQLVGRPAERQADRHVDREMLLGEQAAEADQHREGEDRRPEMRQEVQRRQHGDRAVHAGKAV